jgi:hypothetical protein
MDDLRRFVGQYCPECSGPVTRSNEYAPEQPVTSSLCAPCWYNTQHPDVPLLTLDDLDEFADYSDLVERVGQLVDWHSQIAPLVELLDSIYVKVTLTCRCGRASKPYYAASGLHSGAWPYIFDELGHYQGNIRDEEWRCDEHATKGDDDD